MAEPIIAAHLPVIAAIHHAAFGAAAWSLDSFATLLGMPFTFGFIRESGFILVRAVAGEAEILTVAVTPETRRRGIARALLEAALAETRRRGAKQIFLEAAEDNAAAIALYAGMGFIQNGRRDNYYGPGVAALLLSRELEAA